MIKKLTEREHILTRPTMYIGAVDLTTSNEYILSDDKIEYKEVKYVPGLIKIINEIIDNSVDVAIKTNFKSSNEISVKITSDEVQVQDNGTGIPIKQNDDGHYLPELCWNHARAGSNFDDDKNRTQIGMNGVGSYATACFSKKFVGNTDDGINNYTITIKDNASSFTEKLDKTKSQGTTVKFYPDLEKFGLNEIDETHISIIKQRLINLSMTFPEIAFKFNGKKININSFKKYISLFGPVSEIYETEDYRFAILPNESDDFKQFSYVNGLKIPDGGTHIDVIINNIVNPIREKLIKKYKTLKPADIKNKLMVVAFLKNLSNTKFNSQTKEKITNSVSELVQYYGNIDFTKITNKILKTPEIIDPITEVYKIKEELKKRQEMKGLDKTVKKIKSEKYTRPTGSNKLLVICEGQCLDENTEIIVGDYGIKKIKDINQGDYILSGDLSIQQVESKVKLLKETITIETKSGKIIMGKKHKLKVYNISSQTFEFATAQQILDNSNNYKLLKSKINKNTLKTKIVEINFDKSYIQLEDGIISYTTDDFFVILRDKNILRVNSLDLNNGDYLIMG